MLSPLASNIYFPALTSIVNDLDVSASLVNVSISTYILLQGIAPIFTAQLSDTAGRRPIYLLCLVIFLAANVGLGIQNNFTALLVLRCVQSAGSSGVQTLSNAVAADIATPAERGSYVSFAAAAPVLATTLGPIIGGLLAQFAGWHSGFWLLAAVAGVLLLPMAAFFPETCRNVVGNGSIPPPRWNKCYTNTRSQLRNIKRSHAEPLKIKVGFPNPLPPIMLLFNRQCRWPLLYSSIVSCPFYSTLALIPSVFSSIYGYNELQISLCYLPFGLGATIAAIALGRVIDFNFNRHAARLGIAVDKTRRMNLDEFPTARARLEVAVPTIVLSMGSSIAFGWMLQKAVHVSGPLAMLFLVGFCCIGSLNCLAALLLDINPSRAGTITASNNLLRCLLGTAVTGATVPMIQAVGIGWTLTIFGGLNAVFMPLLWYIMKVGSGRRVKV
ncbi:hypothetical protein MCOR25_000143 [Pyricularia grisea]|nr:hypothetical protein MCOR25_000143 [Pyricularia grisea]